ncbi:MAG: hydroxymethylbilane synthase [Gammaproteobacteria bacterium]
MKLRIATRGSHLARTQATFVADELTALGHEPELVIVTTSGDQSDAPSFGAIGPTGVFVREIEQALLDDAADIAVHSFKDLPTESPEELKLASIPRREDAADVLVVQRGSHNDSLGPLPIANGATVGTSSARRQAWLKHLRSDLDVQPLRGNVPTRVGKVGEGYDGIILAAAGLNRLQESTLDDRPELGLSDHIVERLDPEVFVPAPAQGAIALQCRSADGHIVDALSVIAHGPTETCVAVERALLMRVEGGCDVAFGAYCTEAPDGMLQLVSMLEHDGRLIATKTHDKDPHALVDIAWETLAES